MDDDSAQRKESTEDSLTRSQRERQIGSLVTRLLSHYWTAGEPEALRREQAADWLTDLERFDPMTVATACGEWRITQTRKPTIADIVRLCREFEHSLKPDRSKQPVNPTEDYKGEFASVAERNAAIQETQEKYRKAELWRQSAAGQSILAGMRPRPSVTPTYTSEQMRRAQVELGITAIEKPNKADNNDLLKLIEDTS